MVHSSLQNWGSNFMVTIVLIHMDAECFFWSLQVPFDLTWSFSKDLPTC